MSIGSNTYKILFILAVICAYGLAMADQSKSNVVTVGVTGDRSLDGINLEIKNLLSKVEKLEDEHLKIRREKVESMSVAENRRLVTHNMAVTSGMERELRTLSGETASQIAAFGEPAVPILLEELAVLSSEIHYLRCCIARSLRQIGRAAVPYLIEALQGRAPTVKVAHGKYEKVVTAKYGNVIISTLGQIGDLRAVEPLLDAFQGPRTGSVLHTHTIATALGFIGDKRAVEPIIGALEDCLEGAENTADCDEEGYHMRIYVEALGRLGDSRAVPVLKKALNSGPQKIKGGAPYYLVAEEAARALRSLGVQVEGKNSKYHIVTDPPEEAKLGRVLFSDGREFVGKVFVQGGDNEWQRIERVEQQLKITCWDGRTRNESVYTKDPSLEEVFVKTRDGWRPALGEPWPSLDSSTLSRTYVKEIIFGEKPSDSERQEFHEYWAKYHKDFSERQWGAYWAKLSKNMPTSWEKWPTSKQQCYRNLAMIKWASFIDWNTYTPVKGDVSLMLLFGSYHLDPPVCPAGGKYSAGSTWVNPRCSTHGTPEVFLEAKVEEILNRLYTAMEKAYADVGLSKEDIQGLLSRQQPHQKAMGKWKAYQEAWPAIVKARNAAIEQMASLGPSAVPVLLEAKDKSNERRGGDIFVLAITKIGKAAVPAVINGLSHVDAVVRARAATSLGRMRDKRAVEHLIRSLSDPDKRVVRTAVRSLGLLKDIAATEPLLELWHKGQVVSRTSIASTLGQIGDKRAAEPIMAALEECVSKAQQTGNWDMNSWAMRVYAGALGQIGDTQAIPLLKKMLDTPPQRTKALTPIYLVANAAARALRSLGLEVTGDREKGGYKVIEVASLAEIKGNVKKGIIREDRGYQKAAGVPQPVERRKVKKKKYGYGGNPQTWQKLQTDAKGQYPILLTWPLRKGASKYVVQLKGVRGSRPATVFELVTNSLCLEESDIAPGRYQWSVSVYDKHGKFMGDIETTDSVEIFSIEDPQPVAANGKRVMIDLNHSAGHMRGWGYYNHAQYMTRELLENAGFEVEVNKRDLLTAARLRGVDLLICHYYWTGWPGFRPYLKSELSAVRKFIKKGGSLLVVGCDRKDGANMSKAGNQLVEEFGLMFELGEISKQHGLAELESDQNIISFSKPVPVQLSVGVRGQDAITLLQFNGLPIVKAKQFGRGKVIVAGVGMSFLDCYLGDFEHREPLHLIMFYDFIRYLTGIDWKKNCKQEFIEMVLSRFQFQEKRALNAGPKSSKEPQVAEEAARALHSLGLQVTGDREKGGCRVVETNPPDEAQRILREYLRCVEQADAETLKDLLCFNDKRDKELFMAFSSTQGRIYVRSNIFPKGKPAEQKRAGEDCWIIVLDDGHLLELWKVEGQWKVLCPTPGRRRMAEAKLTRAEMYRHLNSEEIKRVQSESDAKLQGRRARYIAVLDLAKRHQIKNLHHYFSGIPSDDPVVLVAMSLDEFRKAVILKLDAPYGLRYRAEPKKSTFYEGEPVVVTFSIENVTVKAIKLRYRPGLQIVNSSYANTARGAIVFPRGEDPGQDRNPYKGKLAYPLRVRQVNINPGDTFIIEVNLLEYYDLPPARYTVFSRIDVTKSEEGDFWHGYAMTDTKSFEIPSADNKPRSRLEKSHNFELQIEAIVNRLHTAVQKAHEDVGLKKSSSLCY